MLFGPETTTRSAEGDQQMWSAEMLDPGEKGGSEKEEGGDFEEETKNEREERLNQERFA